MAWPGSVSVSKGVVATSGYDPVKIAVLGASESARSANTDNTWPARFTQILCDGGYTDAMMKNLAFHGASFFQANTNAFYGTNTMVQEAINWKPDIVFVEFGGNDLVNVVDGRTLAQVKTDSDTTIANLRAGLPNALIIAILEQGHDSTNFATPAVTLKNKGVATQFMELTAAGVAAGFYSNEMLDVACSAGLKTKVDNLLQLNTYIKANPTIGSNWILLDFWKLQRLGCTTPDVTHHNEAGHQLMAAWVYKQTKALASFQAKFPRLSSQIITDWQDPDALFTYYLTSSADGWVRAAGADVPGLNAGDVNRWWGDQTLISPEEFYLPWKTRVSINPPSLTIQNSTEFDGTFRLIVRGGPPTQVAFLSVDGGAFVSSGESTDTHGNFETNVRAGVFGISNASHAFRFKIGTEVYGPYNITVSAPFNESKTTAIATNTAFSLTAAQMAGSRQVVVKLTGALAGNANLTTDTAANIIAVIPNAYVGQTYRLKIINANAAAFAWTVTAGTGITLSGTLHTIPANTWREYEIKYTGTAALTLESIGTGTWS